MDFTQNFTTTNPGLSLFTMDETQSSMICSSSSTDDSSSSSSNSSMQENDAKQFFHNHHHNNNASSNGSSVSLRQQVMLNQFISITGCSHEQALQLLISSDWQYQVSQLKI